VTGWFKPRSPGCRPGQAGRRPSCTLDALVREFGLEPFPEAYYAQIRTAEVRSVWRSQRYPQLKVIDKVNGGKADALNVGINAARYPLFCGIDADSVLERDSLQRVVGPFLRDSRVVATGGTVRVANGCTIEGGYLTRVGLPDSLLALFQVVEYLRAFLFGRLGWSAISGMLIISGAFGLFRKETVISVGGYRPNTIGEDMELVVRIHRELRARREAYRIEFLPDPVCWTESPEDLATLRNQRIRWQRGLSESLAANWKLVFSRRGGVPGWVAFPFMAAFEWMGPVLELTGYAFMITAYLLGGISWSAFASVHLRRVRAGHHAVGVRAAAGRNVLPHVPGQGTAGQAAVGGRRRELRLSPAEFVVAAGRPAALGVQHPLQLGRDEAQRQLAVRDSARHAGGDIGSDVGNGIGIGSDIGAGR